MMKRIIVILLSIICISLLLLGCAPAATDEQVKQDLGKLSADELDTLVEEGQSQEGQAIAGQALSMNSQLKTMNKFRASASSAVRKASIGQITKVAMALQLPWDSCVDSDQNPSDAPPNVASLASYNVKGSVSGTAGGNPVSKTDYCKDNVLVVEYHCINADPKWKATTKSCDTNTLGDKNACCGGACVDTKSDPNNCGACGAACGAGSVCSGGQCTASCGNGVIEVAEPCDDGNLLDTDACTSQCKTAVCGEGFVQLGVEQCDDGNMDNTDFCKNDCTTAFCGDGVVYGDTEFCDDGNPIDTDACKNNCAPNYCGDSVLHSGVEQCDDGNILNGDGCSACQAEKPDLIVHSAEFTEFVNASGNYANITAKVKNIGLGITGGDFHTLFKETPFVNQFKSSGVLAGGTEVTLSNVHASCPTSFTLNIIADYSTVVAYQNKIAETDETNNGYSLLVTC